MSVSIFPWYWGLNFKNLPTSAVKNSVFDMLLFTAFFRASSMASSTISTPTIPTSGFLFAISWAIVHVPQNKSSTTLSFRIPSSKT